MLRPEEIDRLRFELGVPLTRIGAEPYIGYIAVFDRVITPYLYDNSTTSVTPVTAGSVAVTLAANPAPPNNIGLTFNVGTNCLVDVGPAQEQAVIQSITGLVATFVFANAHGTGGISYPIQPVGSEQIVRLIIQRLDNIEAQMRLVATRTAGIEQADEIKMVPRGGGRRTTEDMIEVLVRQREVARDDLGDAIGFGDWRKMRNGATARATGFEIY